MRTLWDEFERMHKEMDELFSSITDPTNRTPLLEGNTNTPTKISTRRPLTDMWEENNTIRAQVELPGVNKKDININVNDNGVEVSVEKENKKEEDKKGYYRCERSYSGYYRQFPLPQNADTDNIDASYKDGVLEMTIPKKEVDENTKRIEVK
ncbi:MAG: Hsp20/alpha crystallin family protein [Nanobdellota archaeon]